jgi:cell wall-associated NlpC family hydrolase
MKHKLYGTLISIPVIIGSFVTMGLSSTTALASTHGKTVTAMASFPVRDKPHKDLLSESISVSTVGDGEWVSETMSVPKTQSTAEKQAAADAQAKAAQDAADQQAREQAQSAAVAASNNTVSRNYTRSDPASDGTTSASSAGSSPTVTAVPTLSTDQQTRGQQIAMWSVQFVGRPYVYGGTSPTDGWDCSAFVQYVFAHFGITLPRVSGAQANVGVTIPQGQMMPGDIIANSQHAAIYIGNGMVMNAASPRKGTIISPLSGFPGAYTIARVY